MLLGALPQLRESLDDVAVAVLRRRAEETGRGRIPVTIFGAPADPRVLEEYERAGADRVVRWLPTAQRGPVERVLEGFEDAVRELYGE